jgi:ABC-type glycerol-3-phosphate transport system permease component
MRYSLIVVASVPMLIAYPFVQKHFVNGIMMGAIKG